MWSDNGSAELAAQLKELQVKYTKATSRCRRAELELNKQKKELETLRKENDTLRITPLLSKGSGSSRQGNNSLRAKRPSEAQSRVNYLEKALKEREEEIRKLKRSNNSINLREAKANSEEYLAEIHRLKNLLYGIGSSNSSPNILAQDIDRNRVSKTSRKQSILKENKRLRRSLEAEKDRYRRFLVSEISADKMLDAEMEPFRHGYSMGDIIEAQNVEINRLREQCRTLKENNEVLQGSLGKALAYQRVEGL